jgi:hypothetical protein
VRDDVVVRADDERDADAAVGRITPAQIREWREIMAWSDGEGLDPVAYLSLCPPLKFERSTLAQFAQALRRDLLMGASRGARSSRCERRPRASRRPARSL